MNKTMILEAAYNTIKNSLEWGIGEGSDYSDYVDGVVGMTEELLKMLNETENTESVHDSQTN